MNVERGVGDYDGARHARVAERPGDDVAVVIIGRKKDFAAREQHVAREGMVDAGDCEVALLVLAEGACSGDNARPGERIGRRIVEEDGARRHRRAAGYGHGVGGGVVVEDGVVAVLPGLRRHAVNRPVGVGGVPVAAGRSLPDRARLGIVVNGEIDHRRCCGELRLAGKQRTSDRAAARFEVGSDGRINDVSSDGIVNARASVQRTGKVVASGHRIGRDAETVEVGTFRNIPDCRSSALYVMLGKYEKSRGRGHGTGCIPGFVDDLRIRREVCDNYAMLLRRAQRNTNAICLESPVSFEVARTILAGGGELTVAIDVCVEGKFRVVAAGAV